MAVSADRKRAKAAPRINDVAAVDWLQKNDIRLFCTRCSAKSAKNEIQASLNGKMSSQRLMSLAREHCVYFANARRRAVSRSHALSAKQWDRVKSAVSSLLVELHGVPIDWAVEMVRTRISCSRQILEGLPSRLRVWTAQ